MKYAVEIGTGTKFHKYRFKAKKRDKAIPVTDREGP
jgi:hypothetical protein